MTRDEAYELKQRIQTELPADYTAMVQSRLFSLEYSVSVMRKPVKAGFPHRIPGFPDGITSFRQWRANRRKLSLS